MAVSASDDSDVADFQNMCLKSVALEEEDRVFSVRLKASQSSVGCLKYFMCVGVSETFIIWHFFTFYVLNLELFVSVFTHFIYIYYIYIILYKSAFFKLTKTLCCTI